MKNRVLQTSISLTILLFSISANAQDEGGVVSSANVQSVNSSVPVSPVPSGLPSALEQISAPPPGKEDREVFRENPFLPEMSDSERASADAEESRRRDIQQMIPQLRRELIPEIRDIIRQEYETAAKSVPLGPDGQPLAMGGAVGGTAEGVASGLAIPLGAPGAPQQIGPDGKPLVDALSGIAAKVADPGRPLTLEAAAFTACINGKALYRDTTGVTFVNEKDETTCIEM